jgi:hypothetical protein
VRGAIPAWIDDFGSREKPGSHDDLVEDPETYWSTRAALPWN